MSELQVLRRTFLSRKLSELCSVPDMEGSLIAALGQKDGQSARLYFTDDVPAERYLPAETPDIGWMRLISDAAIVEVVCDPSGQAPLPLKDCKVTVGVSAPETEVFAGRNTLLGQLNQERPEVLRDWLVWHARHHGADAALVVDRSPPGHADTLAQALRDVLGSDAEAREVLGGMQIMLVDIDHPLGRAEQGSERHPMNAPDAPGKDRMDPPAPDGWHAPLSWRTLFELLRESFLARARAVAQIDVVDLIAPLTPSVFDQAREAPLGVVPLLGERIYPWGLRKDVLAGFGDHICRRFDPSGKVERWCAAPDLLPKQTIWLMRRILGAKTDTPALPFWRFMALRHGGEDPSKVGQIVPKSSLIEDDRLIALAEQLGGNPMRMPPDEMADQGALPHPSHPERSDRVAVVTTMKNEGPFILEWIAYHRAIGVEDFLVYTNDCTDGTDSFLQLLDRKGYIQWRDNPYRVSQMKPQHAALDAAGAEPMIQQADWVICMDVDEYIAVHTGDHTLRALFEAVPQANLISLTWRLFGNDDVDVFHDGFITQQFTRCARAFANKPHQAWGFKTLFRNAGLFRKLGVHRPKGLMPQALDRINWVNGSGKPMPKSQWRNAWRSNSGTYGYDLVSLNHYAVRSAESFLVKRDRGRVNHVDRDQGMAYWFRMNHNVVEDRRMMDILPLLQAEFDAMMADPEIAAHHLACVAAHRAKIDELKAQPNYQRFHVELNSDRMRKLSRLHGHFGSNVYLAGPEVIPDEIVQKDPAESFSFTVEHVEETQH